MTATDHYRIRPSMWGIERTFVLERLFTRSFLWWKRKPKWVVLTYATYENKQQLIDLVEHLRAHKEYV